MATASRSRARSRSAAIFDLDRTLIAGSSAPVFTRHLRAVGLGPDRDIPLVDQFYRVFEAFGENPVAMQAARFAARAAVDWPTDQVAEATKAAAQELLEEVQPFVPSLLDEHREAGRLLVMATTSPEPFVRPFAEALGFDAVVATRWEEAEGRYTGHVDGEFLWGRAKKNAVVAWAEANNVRLDRSHAYSDSYYDAPLLDAVGHPVAVNPDLQLQGLATLKGWPVRHLDVSEGVLKIAGRELQEWIRPFGQPDLIPNATFEFEGLEHIPARGGAIIVFNHRSYFDPTVMGLLSAKANRSVRGLGKKEVFDAPVVGWLAKALGGIRVERASGSDEPLEAAADAIRAGEMVMLAPQGTIPRGAAFFDPELKGRWGAAKLAAMTKAPVIPVGIWGTEKVWPRSSRLPKFSIDRPHVTATVGPPVELDLDDERFDPDQATKQIMAAIVDLLPPEARMKHTPTEEELALTYPSGYSGDVAKESDRRPGTDT